MLFAGYHSQGLNVEFIAISSKLPFLPFLIEDSQSPVLELLGCKCWRGFLEVNLDGVSQLEGLPRTWKEGLSAGGFEGEISQDEM